MTCCNPLINYLKAEGPLKGTPAGALKLDSFGQAGLLQRKVKKMRKVPDLEARFSVGCKNDARHSIVIKPSAFST